MLIALLGLAFVLICSSLALTIGAFKSARARGGVGRGRLFDRVSLPWTMTALVLLVVVLIGLIVVLF
ncbi:hypothetical protein M3667_01865 [Microbacterium sp. P26]|uniref:hypothetical protein n=1 Tax=Microbacterium TaxID=33882 RepID=UPI00203FDABA|nr:hypothetical protein [Microbacterium sp. P26]MCM3500624.1 hypothetical protein [Microbacterium sp. P26]